MTASGAASFRRRVFVVMPFGKKEVPPKPEVDATCTPSTNASGLVVDFDDVYRLLLAPALEAAGLQPFRADDENSAGDILKDMFAELVTADFVVADISILNANVFYELGIRHAVGPRGVICLHAGWATRPFDVAPGRTFKYDGKLFCVDRVRDEAWEKAVAKEKDSLASTLRKAVAADRTTEGSPVYSNLPNLKPLDASRIGTARFKFYEDLAKDWQDRIDIAARGGRAEDILTLAGDVPSPYYRRKLLRQCAGALLALCRFAQAEKIYTELHEELQESDSLDEFRLRCQLALVANRLGRTKEAKIALDALAKKMPGDPEAQGILGRVYKNLWAAKWDANPPLPLEERLRAAQSNAALARKALASYETAFRRDIGSYYNGINLLALASLLDHVAMRNNRPAPSSLIDFNDVASAVRLAATARLEVRDEAVWARATLGELRIVLGDANARSDYEDATADADLTWFNISSMLDQVELFEALDYEPAVVQPVAKLLRERRDERSQAAASQFRKVVICGGHMIDKPDRPTPRFPPEKEAAVRAAIAQQLEAWEIGPADLAICGGARGADILFAEECQRRETRVELLLAQEVDDFVAASVRLPSSKWVERFNALRKTCQVETQPARLGQIPQPEESANASQFPDVYTRNNIWIINTARVKAPDSSAIYAIVVWDEREMSDGPGGTSDFQKRVCQLGGVVEIINPGKLS